MNRDSTKLAHACYKLEGAKQTSSLRVANKLSQKGVHLLLTRRCQSPIRHFLRWDCLPRHRHHFQNPDHLDRHLP